VGGKKGRGGVGGKQKSVRTNKTRARGGSKKTVGGPGEKKKRKQAKINPERTLNRLD